MKRIALSLTFGFVLALLLVACDSGDPAPQTGVNSPAPPKAASAEFIKSASQTIIGSPAKRDEETGAQSDCEDDITRKVILQDPAGTGDYRFDPSELNFTKGECVSFTLTSETEFHTFTVEALDIDVSVDGGMTERTSFTFDAPGEYKLTCIPHELLGMVGTITVSE